MNGSLKSHSYTLKSRMMRIYSCFKIPKTHLAVKKLFPLTAVLLKRPSCHAHQSLI